MSDIYYGERLLTELDFARLSKLDKQLFPPELVDGLESADLVPSQEIPSDVITMYSQFVIVNNNSKREMKLTLCYPKDAEASMGCISILSPVGSSLLGLRQGETAHWHTPQGERHSAIIADVLFQPEASGDYTT